MPLLTVVLAWKLSVVQELLSRFNRWRSLGSNVRTTHDIGVLISGESQR